VLHDLLISPTSDCTPDGTTAPIRDPFPLVLTLNTLDHDRIVVPVGRGLFEKVVILRDGFNTKRKAKHGSVIYHPMPESARTARTVRENHTHPSCRIKVPKYALPRKLELMRKQVANSTPNHQQTDAGTSFSCEELRRERAPCQS
jgi:hypothetical protein